MATGTKLRSSAVLLLAGALFGSGATLAFPSKDDKAADKAKTDPPGVPLELRLVAKKNTYTLDLAGKTPAEFRKQLEGTGKNQAFPPPPTVDLAIELHNTGDKELQFLTFDSDGTTLNLKLDGTGATRLLTRQIFYRRVAVPKWVKLAAGKSITHPLQKLADYSETFGSLAVHQSYWTAAGDYTLSASFKTAILPAPKGADEKVRGFAYIMLTSNPVKLKVTEAKEGANGK